MFYYLLIALINALIESLFALAFLRQKKVAIFLVVNLIVNPLALWLFRQWSLSLEAIVWIEIGVFIVEAVAVGLLWGKKERWEAIAISILGNTITLIISFLGIL